MIIKLAYNLSYNNNKWYCKNNDFQCTSTELEEIDDQIYNHIKSNNKEGKYQIDLLFDFDSFPLWMRQYMPHYFNRTFTIEL